MRQYGAPAPSPAAVLQPQRSGQAETPHAGEGAGGPYWRCFAIALVSATLSCTAAREAFIAPEGLEVPLLAGSGQCEQDPCVLIAWGDGRAIDDARNVVVAYHDELIKRGWVVVYVGASNPGANGEYSYSRDGHETCERLLVSVGSSNPDLESGRIIVHFRCNYVLPY